VTTGFILLQLGQAAWIIWAEVIIGPGLKNPWVYGFGFYSPRPEPANPMGQTFYPLADPRVENLSQTRALIE